MMHSLIVRALSYLPLQYTQEIKRWYFRLKICMGTFRSEEEEFDYIDKWINTGDWVIDIGANIGHYTLRMSNLVGKTGHVIALEPVADSFELLTSNMAFLKRRNITLLNAAASDTCQYINMQIPTDCHNVMNYYQASICREPTGMGALAISIDSLNVPKKVRLVKIDAEGHDYSVITGMTELIRRDRPILIIESHDDQIVEYLKPFGYSYSKLSKRSPNRVFMAGSQS